MRPLARALVVAALLAAVAPAAPAAPPSAEAARLAAEWAGADDAARERLLAAAVAAPSRATLDAAWRAARSSLGVRQESARLLKAYEAARKDLGPQAKEDDPRLARDRAEADGLRAQDAREAAALARLAAAWGRLLDLLPEGEAKDAAQAALAAVPDPGLDGVEGWAGEALGASRLPRTAVLLLDAADDARRQVAKLSGERDGPARKLDEVVRKLNDLVGKYLENQRKRGDHSGLVPVGLVGQLPDQKADLERTVNRLGQAIEAADRRRAAAREALGAMVAGSPDADAARLLDLVEGKCLRHEDAEMRRFGLLVVGRAKGPRALATLLASARAADPREAAAAVDALGGRPEPEVVPALAVRLADAASDWRVRAAAAAALAATGRRAAVPPLLDAMKDAKGRLLDDLREALVALTGRSYPAAEAPWRRWWDLDGERFLGPKDEKPAAPPVAQGPAPAEPAAPAPVGDGQGVHFYGIETRSTKVLFVLDFSGSMNFAGSERDAKLRKVDVLRSEMRKALAGLPDGSTFNLVAFSSDVRVWKGAPQTRTSKTAADAVEWVDKAQADGATNIGDALEKAFQLTGAGLRKDRDEPPAYDTILFMTDGRPTIGKTIDPKLILGAVRRLNEGRKVRLHVVGVGGHEKPPPGGGGGAGGGAPAAEDDLDEEFLRALAGQNGGQCVLR